MSLVCFLQALLSKTKLLFKHFLLNYFLKMGIGHLYLLHGLGSKRMAKNTSSITSVVDKV